MTMSVEIGVRPASLKETASFQVAGFAGVELWHTDIASIIQTDLCREQRRKQPRRTDDAYLCASDTTPRMVQWYARHADGYRRPFGITMVVVNDPREV